MTIAAIMLSLGPAPLEAGQKPSDAVYAAAAREILATSETSNDRGDLTTVTPITREKTKLKWLILGMVAAQVADIATTSIALHRGCVETSYYGLQNKWAIGGMKAGGTIALTVTLPVFHNNKPKLSKALAWAQIGSGVLGAAFNATRLPHCR